MTADELNVLTPGTLIYLPVIDDVQIWEFAGSVHGRSWYTFNYPPDQDGVVNNRRPIYLNALDLFYATLDEKSAWTCVLNSLNDRIGWIQRQKLDDP